jgi:hypothetical protein
LRRGRRLTAFAAEFDSTKPIKLRGTVVKMEWINPHTWLHLDVKTPKGTVERWMIEGGPPNALYRRGVTKESLPNGVEILVEGFRAKDGSLRGNGRDRRLPTGAGCSWFLPAPARQVSEGIRIGIRNQGLPRNQARGPATGSAIAHPVPDSDV